MSSQAFDQVQPCRLFQELGLGCMSRVVTKRQQHCTWEIDDLGIELEHTSSRLKLSLESMGGGAKHHQGAGELHQELLARENSSDMLDNLAISLTSSH